VSIAIWNLKEAAGKALARRTEIAYEAAGEDEKAHIFKVQYLSGTTAVYAAGISVKAGEHYPGKDADVSRSRLRIPRPYPRAERGRETGALTFDDESDAA